MNYTLDELKKIQNIELDCFREAIRVCKELNIDYFAMAGTVLGAVRHRGFIPWDDDIDIGMTRDDYHRFLEEAPKLLQSKYVIQSPYNTKNTPYAYSKIRVKGTKFVEYSNRKLKIESGIYVDLFPFDKTPNNKMLSATQYYLTKILLKVYNLKHTPDLVEPVNMKNFLKYCIRKMVHYITVPIPHSFLTELIDYVMTYYNKKDLNKYAFLFYPKRDRGFVFEDEIRPTQRMKFENIEINIPRNEKEYLERLYPNFMQLPPIEKRVGHRPYLVDLG